MKQHHERGGDGNTSNDRREHKWRWRKSEWIVEEEVAKRESASSRDGEWEGVGGSQMVVPLCNQDGSLW